MNRKRLTTALILPLLLIASCGDSGDSGAGGGSEPIRLGVVGPLTGAQAEIGENHVAGAEVAAELINKAGGVNGRQIEIVTQDEQGSPETAAAAIRNLANNDGVNLQLGMLSSANCLATAPTLESLEVVMVTATCTNDALTGQDGAEAPFANFFRVGAPDREVVGALANVVAEKNPDTTKYRAFGYDYVTGRTQWDVFQKDLAAKGINVEVQGETFVPLGEQNYGPLVSALAREADAAGPATGLYLGLFGAGTASFLQQAQPFDIDQKFAFIAQPGGYYPVARTLNGQAPEVINSYDYNYAAYDNEMNAQFVEAFEAKTGAKPVTWSYQAYLAVHAYAAAIAKASSTETADVIAALEGITFETPQGAMTLDATTHQANANQVVTLSVGDSTAPEGVKILETTVVKPEDL